VEGKIDGLSIVMICCCVDLGFVGTGILSGGVGVSTAHSIWVFRTSSINDGLSGILIFSNSSGVYSSSESVG